jgi:hypothetical protein
MSGQGLNSHFKDERNDNMLPGQGMNNSFVVVYEFLVEP